MNAQNKDVKIIVYVKETAFGTHFNITQENKLSETGMSYQLNEWDRYAMEEALLIRDKFGGSVTAIALGQKRLDKVLRECLALGADRAIRIWDSEMSGSDSYAIAKVLHQTIRSMEYDLVLTGSQDDEDMCTSVAPALAQMLGIQYATLAIRIQLKGGKARVHRELEEGIEEIMEVDLPAVFTVQTGINLPRYTSFSGIKKAKKKELKRISLKDLGLSEMDVGKLGSKVTIDKLYIPEMVVTAKILDGTPGEIANKLLSELSERGAIK